MDLTQAKPHTPMRVVSVDDSDSDNQISRRLLELGFIPGSIVEIRNMAPLFQDPIAVLVRGMVVALRKYEAQKIKVATAAEGSR
jgi:ferrous iron transport protein A